MAILIQAAVLSAEMKCSPQLDPPVPEVQLVTVFLLAFCYVGMADTVGASSDGPTSCCGRLQAVLFQARVRYANETGRLLLPEASARACIEVTFASVPDIAS
jgi:hypothetical protein